MPVILLEMKNVLKNKTEYNYILENKMLDKEDNSLKKIKLSDKGISFKIILLSIVINVSTYEH